MEEKNYKLKFFISATYVSGLHIETRLKVSVVIDCVCLEVLCFQSTFGEENACEKWGSGSVKVLWKVASASGYV